MTAHHHGLPVANRSVARRDGSEQVVADRTWFGAGEKIVQRLVELVEADHAPGYCVVCVMGRQG